MKLRLLAALSLAALSLVSPRAQAVPQTMTFDSLVFNSQVSTFDQDAFRFVLTGGAPPTWTTWSGAPLVNTGVRSFSGGGNDAQQGSITRIGGGTFTMSSLIVVNYGNNAALTVRAFNGATQVFTQSIAANGSATVNFGNITATEVRLNGNSANAGANFGTTFGFDNFTIDVANAAPTLGSIEGDSVNYTQGGSPVVLDASTAMTVADADSADFNGGRLSVSFSAGGFAGEDVLSVGNVGTITLTGVDVFDGATQIGSITSSGVNGNPLVITLNANATVARTQNLARAIRYSNTNSTNNPEVGRRTVRWSLDDGDGAPPRAYLSSVRFLPLIPGGSVVRVEMSGTSAPSPALSGFPKTFDAGGFRFVTGDGNNATNCDNGCFGTSFDAPNSPAAQIQANGLASVTTTVRRTDNSSFVLVSAVVGNRSSQNLTVTARNGATVLDTRVLASGSAQQLIFPNLTVTELRVQGNSTVLNSLQVGYIDDVVVAVTNAPSTINNLVGDTATFTQGGAAVTLDQGTAATVVDPDSANYNGGSLTAQVSGNPWTNQDVLGIGAIGPIALSGANVQHSGTTIGTVAGGSNGNNLVVTFNTSATVARVQDLVRALTYNNTNTNTATGVAGPDLGDRTIRVTLNDGGGAPPSGIETTVRVRQPAVTGSVTTAVDFNGLTVSGTPNTLDFQSYRFSISGGANAYLGNGFGVPGGTSLRGGANDIASQTLVIQRVDGATFQLVALTIANLSRETARTIVTRNGATVVQTLSLAAGGTQRVVFNGSAVTRIEITGTTGLTTAGLVVVDDLVIVVPNTAPSVTLDSGTLAYTEDAGFLLVSPNAAATDIENNWTGGTLTAQITANADATNDRLAITTANGFSLSGTTVLDGGVGFGTANISGGTVTGGAALTVTFNANANATRVQNLVRSIGFATLTQTPSTATRTVTLTLADALAASTARTRLISVTSVNDPPTVTLDGGTVNYTEDAAPVQISPSATAGDLDGNWNGGNLTVSITANADLSDYLQIASVGGIAVNVLAVNDGATTFGTLNVVGGIVNGTSALTVTFNANATDARVQALARAFTFSSNSQNPPTTTRTITFALTDGATTTVNATRLATVTATNDAPTFTLDSGTLNYTEDDPPALLSPTALANDPEANWTGGTLTAQISANASADDGLRVTTQGTIGASGIAVVDNGTTFGTMNAVNGAVSGSNTLIITFNAAATNARVQGLSRALGFVANAQAPSALTRTVTLTLTDAASAATTRTRQVTVTAVNDPPSITLDSGAASYAEDAAAVAMSAGATASDPEANWTGGTLTAVISVNADTQDRLSILTSTGLSIAGTVLSDGATPFATLSASGGTVSAGDTLTVTFNADATSARVQNLLRALAFNTLGDTPNTTTRTVTVTLSDGATASATSARDVTVSAVNDAPVLTAPAAANVFQGLITPVGGLSVADVDAGGGALKLDFAIAGATLNHPGGSGVTVTGAGTGALTLTGNLADLNTALAANGVAVTVPIAATGALSLVVTLDDQGNTGGAAQTQQRTIPLTVQIPLIADLSVTIDNGTTLVLVGQTVTYTLTASNVAGDAIAGARVVMAPLADLFGVSWTCAATGTAACGAASGVGVPDTTADLSAGGQVVYTITATVAPEAADPLIVGAGVSTPAGARDDVAANDTAFDTDTSVMIRDGFE